MTWGDLLLSYKNYNPPLYQLSYLEVELTAPRVVVGGSLGWLDWVG